jgi:arylsulfatase A-like enzyme
MRPASLLCVMVLAKVLALAGHRLALNWWSPVAYFWHDAVVIAVASALDLALAHRPRVAWTAYAAAALYVAMNVPVMRAVSTPLTWSMWRAARGPLADSIRFYLTWENALLFLCVLAVAALAPVVFRDVQPRFLLLAATAVAALGPVAQDRVTTFGLERNAYTALIPATFPRISPTPAAAWSTSGFDRARQEDLTRFRGAAAGRNVILVSLESTAAQYLGLYGAAPDPMPHLTALAGSAVVFDNAYAVYPESIKGLFSILCSTYPPFDHADDTYAAVPCDSLPDALGRHGYRTGLFHSGRFGYLGMESVVRHRGFETLADAGDIGGNRSSSFGVDEPSTIARILQWIDARPAGQPFFVTYLPIAGHHPYETPDAGPFPDGDSFGRYRNALHYGDASLGALIDGIAARGLRDNTLWIILGDHGEAFGQHDGNFGHTFQLYEENIHVPLLIAAPGLISHQLRSRQVVSLIDTTPGLLELVGVPAPVRYQGRSFLDPSPRLAFFFADYSLGLLGLRDGGQKLIYELNTNRSQLFDLTHDPGETVDLSARTPSRTRWYVENLRAWNEARSPAYIAASRQVLQAGKSFLQPCGKRLVNASNLIEETLNGHAESACEFGSVQLANQGTFELSDHRCGQQVKSPGMYSGKSVTNRAEGQRVVANAADHVDRLP